MSKKVIRRYQLYEYAKKENHAGTKAVEDAHEILASMGYESLYIHLFSTRPGLLNKIGRQLVYLHDFHGLPKKVEEGSFILIQYPLHHRQINRNHILRAMKEKKKIHVIALVHDIEELRKTLYDSYHIKEFEDMLGYADCFIVHNDRMKAFLMSKGISEERIVSLGIFDYLMKEERSEPEFSKNVLIAGNLEAEKAGYIKGLGELNRVQFELYGPNFNPEHERPNIHYNGSFPSEELPERLGSGFGLVWDGDSIRTCDGNAGEYLKYNDPHKLSLFLALGLPVFVWKQAAVADFVRERQVGFCIDSLLEMQDILSGVDRDSYHRLAENVKAVSEELRNGDYLKNAVRRAEDRISAECAVINK